MNYKRKFKQKRMDNIIISSIPKSSPAWVFIGNGWTNRAKVRANKLFSKYMGFKQYPAFNYWGLIKIANDKKWIIASRFTWNCGYIGGSWLKLEEELNSYYKVRRLSRKIDEDIMKEKKQREGM